MKIFNLLFVTLFVLTRSLICFGQTNTPRTTGVFVTTTNGTLLLVVTNRASWEAALGFLSTNNADLRYFPLLTGSNPGEVPTWNGSAWVLNIPSGGGTNYSTGGIASITFLAPLSGGTITTQGTVSISQVGSNSNGYMDSNQFNTLMVKEPAIADGASNQFWFNGKAWKVVDWSNIVSKPSVFTPDTHSHTNYLTAESDPVFTNSPAYGITSTNKTNWNTAFGWGNHALYGYITNYTETDPIFASHILYPVTMLLTNQWGTGYNHSTSNGNPHATQITNITGLRGDLDSRSLTNHGHPISAVTNLQSELDGKASTNHTQAISTITDLQTSLDGKYDKIGGLISGNLVMQTNSNIQFSNNVGTKIILYDMGSYGRTNYEFSISQATLEYKIPKAVIGGLVSKHRFSANEYTLVDIQYGDNETNYLTVYGGIKSTTNGYIFPDGTRQLTSATNYGFVTTNNGDFRYQKFRSDVLVSQSFPGPSQPTDWIVQGGTWTYSGGLIPTGTGGTSHRIMWEKDTAMERVSFRAWVTLTDTNTCVALSREPIIGSKGFLAEMCGTNSTIRFWDYNWSAPVTSAAIPFALVAGRSYLLELRKYDSCNITFTVQDGVTGQSATLSTGGNGDSFGSATGNPGIVHFNGSYKVTKAEFSTGNPRYPRVVIVGDSNTEGVNVGAIGDPGRRWAALLQNKLAGRAIIAGRGGENSASFMPGVAPWTRSITDVESFYPEYVIYAIGSNDNDTNIWKLGLQAELSRIASINAIPILCTVPPRTDGGGGSETDRRTMSEYVRNLGYAYIDIRKAVSTDDATIVAAYNSGDNVHFNYAGHSNIFNRVLQDVPWLLDPALENENQIGPYGKVGIGTVPEYGLHYRSADGTAAIERVVSAAGGPAIALMHARTSAGNKAVIASGDELGATLFMGHNGTEYKTSAYLMATADAAVNGAGGIPSKVTMYLTRPDDSTPSATLIVKNGGLGFNVTPDYAGHINMVGSYSPYMCLDGGFIENPGIYFRAPATRANIQSGSDIVVNMVDDGSWYDRFRFRTNGYFYPAAGLGFADGTFQTTSSTNNNYLARTETATNSWRLQGYTNDTAATAHTIAQRTADGSLFGYAVSASYYLSSPAYKGNVLFSDWYGTNAPELDVFYPGYGNARLLDLYNHSHPLFTSTDTNHWSTAYGWGNHSGLYLPLHGKADDADALDGYQPSSTATASTIMLRDSNGYASANAYKMASVTTEGTVSSIIGKNSTGDGYLYDLTADQVKTFIGYTGGGSNVVTLTNIPFANGSSNAPSITFSNDMNTGFYLAGGDSLGMALGGVRAYLFDPTGLTSLYGISINSVLGTVDINDYGNVQLSAVSGQVGVGCTPSVAGVKMEVFGPLRVFGSGGEGGTVGYVKADDYRSSWGNSGITTNITVLRPGPTTNTLVFENGLLIGVQ